MAIRASTIQDEAAPQSLLPQMAWIIARTFPELEGRALAVAEADQDKLRVSKLPLCMVAMLSSTNTSPAKTTTKSTYNLVDRIVVEFWMKPEKYKRSDNSETPFWSYYDPNPLRDRLLNYFHNYIGPQGERVSYVSLDIDASEFAVVLTFVFDAAFQWCYDAPDEDECGVPSIETDGQNPSFILRVCSPKIDFCEEDQDTEEEESKCP